MSYLRRLWPLLIAATCHADGWQAPVNKALEQLARKPADQAVHAELSRILKQMQEKDGQRIREERIAVLMQSVQRFSSDSSEYKQLQTAIEDITNQEERQRVQRWESRCDQVEVAFLSGRLFEANAGIFNVLAENPSYGRAQQILSRIQAEIHRQMDARTSTGSEEYYALAGYFAYGQADYHSAAEAWSKTRAIATQSTGPKGLEEKMKRYGFQSFEADAQRHVESARRMEHLRGLFNEGVESLGRARYAKALDLFRQIVVIDPDYPELGGHLARAEAGVEHDRNERLGEKRRKELAKKMTAAVKAFEETRYSDAEGILQAILTVEPEFPQAQTFLAMAQTELRRRQDPAGAQQHYEAGLVAYASGRLEDAIREWKLALRLDARHAKAKNALAKVRKELALNRDLP
jgi:tetratricopeptide (TPR) repeat protein